MNWISFFGGFCAATGLWGVVLYFWLIDQSRTTERSFVYPEPVERGRPLTQAEVEDLNLEFNQRAANAAEQAATNARLLYHEPVPELRSEQWRTRQKQFNDWLRAFEGKPR